MYIQAFMFNTTSLMAVARMERWYRRHHTPEAMRKLGPWLRRYESWRTIGAEDDLTSIGFYNYRWTELWYDRWELHGPPTGLTWYKNQDKDTDAPTDDAYQSNWAGCLDGPHPVSQVFLPGIPDIEIDNHPPPTEPPPSIRWVGLIRFPEDRTAGDKWFIDEVIPGLSKIPGVILVKSSAALEAPEEIMRELSPNDPQQFPWHRWFEVRLTDYEAWLETTLKLLGWQKDQRTLAGGVQPYRDLISTLLLERPDWTLSDLRPYP